MYEVLKLVVANCDCCGRSWNGYPHGGTYRAFMDRELSAGWVRDEQTKICICPDCVRHAQRVEELQLTPLFSDKGVSR